METKLPKLLNKLIFLAKKRPFKQKSLIFQSKVAKK